MKSLVLAAASILVLYGVLGLFGGRHEAGFLSGSPVAHPLLGIAYVLTYFAAWIVAPILLLAAGALWVLARIRHVE